MSIAISLCNSESNGINSSNSVWKLAQSVRLKSGPSGGLRKYERHEVSIRTGRCSELSAEHEVRYTENERFLVITMSRTSGVTKRLYGLVVAKSGSKNRQEFPSVYSRKSFPRLVFSREFQFGVEVASHQDRQTPAETGGQIRPDQWSGR